MLTHDYDNFPSDVFTMMAGVGAKVTIGELFLAFQVALFKSTSLTPILIVPPSCSFNTRPITNLVVLAC
jgi:hypothetical protein